MSVEIKRFDISATDLDSQIRAFAKSSGLIPFHFMQIVYKDTSTGSPVFFPALLGFFASADDPILTDPAKGITSSPPPALPSDPIEKATALVAGISKLSVAAADPTNPISVGTNDSRLLSQVQKDDLTDGGETTLHSHPSQTKITIDLRNETGGTLTKGKLVCITGWSGAHSRPLVGLADKDDPAARPAVAAIDADVPNGTNFSGLVVGELSGLDTTAFSLTDVLVLGDTGGFSRPPNDIPGFTGEVQFVGSVSRVDASSGEIFVNIVQGLDVTTADQVYALAGTNGTPSNTNKYVTDSDPRNTNARTPTGHEATHISGGSDAFRDTDLLEAIVKRLRESGGATLLLGAIADGQLLKRSGTSVISQNPSVNQSTFDEVTVDTTTTSATFADLLTRSLTTITGSKLRILVTFGASNSGINNDVFFRITVDGTAKRGAAFRAIAAGVGASGGVFVEVTGLSAGSHTVKLQWRTSGGTAQVRPVTAPDGEHASLGIKEVTV